MKHFHPYEIAANRAVKVKNGTPVSDDLQNARSAYLQFRREMMGSIETGIMEWNGAVASAVEKVGQQNGLTASILGKRWYSQVAEALRAMETPLHSDLILGVNEPYLTNRMMAGRLRVFGATTMSENPEFMPTTQTEWPRFPYFQVEPGTPKALADAGLTLLANPPGISEDEPNVVGAPIASASYARSPMVSIELRIQSMAEGALLINWSFRGRQGAMAKVFVDGLLDVPAFPVASTDEDRTPNFWTILPMHPGMTIIDLKHVGAGFMWVEHADVHTVTW